MTAPAKTNRTRPVIANAAALWQAGSVKSLVVFSSNAALLFWEKEVQFSGYDGGDPIPTTNMLNGTFETSVPRVLQKGTDLTMTGSFAGASLSDFQAMINVQQTITQIFPTTDGRWCAFFGWLMKAVPQNNQIGNQPQIQITVHRSDWDPTGFVEAGPAYGTGATLTG